MTIRQLFRKVFQETLTEQGFKYKNNYFYRLNGEMIQGVTVHIATGGGGYSIRLACYPYWMHNAINVSDRIRDLKKPYWVEQCEPSVGVICALLDDEQESVRLMKGELDYFADRSLPYLNRIKDKESMVQVIRENKWFAWKVDWNLLLYICYENRSFDFIDEYFEIFKKRHLKPQTILWLNEGRETEMTDQELHEYCVRRFHNEYPALFKFVDNNDLDSKLAPHKAAHEEIADMFRQELKVEVTHLE